MRVERVEASRASTARGEIPRLEPTDLCYRNILFNQEKLNIRRSVQVTATRDAHVVSPVGIDKMKSNKRACSVLAAATQSKQGSSRQH
jgi:hypothetical protein